jgi:DNA-binding winged helix-turn-helix (wHTH) protein
MSKQARHFYGFDSFRLDPEAQVLFRDGEPVSLSPELFETLLVLVRESGHVVGKEDLIKQVWPDTFVEENNRAQYISTLRKVLGDGRHTLRYIETVPKRGYRFAAGVQEVFDGNGHVVGSTHTT